MYFLLNDLIVEFDPAQMVQPLEADRFEALSLDYVAQLGKEMFAEDALAHRKNPERVRRLCYLINLKLPRANAAQFFVTAPGGNPKDVEFSYKVLNAIALSQMHVEQMAGRLNSTQVDQNVWQRLAA